MKNTRYDTRSSEWLGDLTVWKRENAPDNSEQLERLRRNLRRARQEELTPRQAQMITLHYDQGLTMPQIARELGIHPSTVCRTLQRAKARLRRYLQYTL